MASTDEEAPLRRRRPRHSAGPAETPEPVPSADQRPDPAAPPTAEELGLIERSHFTGYANFSLEELRANRSHAVNEALVRAERELKAGNIARAQAYVELATALLDDN